ncbi:hypothetical protein V8F33_013529 [Rhypophila sp. PSN 637]
MARTRAQTAAQKGHLSPAPKKQGKQPQGNSLRKEDGRLQEQAATTRTERSRARPSIIDETPPRGDSPAPDRKRKRSNQGLEPNADPDQKRQRTSPPQPTEISDPAISTGQTDPIAIWVKEGRWPDEESWPEETFDTVPTMERILARKKSFSNPSRKRSNSATSTTPSDQKPREEKSAPYRNAQYPLLLQTKGSYMGKSPLGITDNSKRLCETLLRGEQPHPKESLFDNHVFESVCDNLENKNEARVIQDVSRLIVPSAEQCALHTKHLKHLVESVNEGWNNSIPFTSTRPQPDYSVGFRREAFTDDQLIKLSPFIGDFITGDQSLFMATYYMYFPFLTCEVECGAAALDIADRQNAHSMTLAVRAIVELFRAVKRAGEVHRQLLAFSISHDHQSVRIYGHYPVVDGKDTKYYRHPVRKFDFTELDGKEKWTAYRFTKNVYDIWMPAHFKKVCSAIDQLPSNLDFDVPPLSEATCLSQDLGNLMQSDAGSVSMPVEQDNAGQQGVTPDTSFTGPEVAKRRKGYVRK